VFLRLIKVTIQIKSLERRRKDVYGISDSRRRNGWLGDRILRVCILLRQHVLKAKKKRTKTKGTALVKAQRVLVFLKTSLHLPLNNV
jgi:hypothetical protein